MSFRPQHVYSPAPAGFRDEDFVYTFDSNNTPALGLNLAAGEANENIVLPLHRDAAFLWRATKVFTDSELGVQFRGPDGDLLSEDYEPVLLSFFPSGFLISGFVPVASEPEVLCGRGAVVQINVRNLSAAPVAAPRTAILLFGVKRWEREQ